jgi:hypothetical protein
MKISELIQQGISKANKKVNSDASLKEILMRYNGKRVIINIIGDSIYAIQISSNQLDLLKSESINSEDMYLEIEEGIVEEIISGRIDKLRLMSLILTGGIKMKNIGLKEIDLISMIGIGQQ